MTMQQDATLAYTASDQMPAAPLSVQGRATERSLEDMCTDHQCYVSSGSIRKDAQKFFNCISVPIFDIPVSQVIIQLFELNTMQVCPPGLHVMLGSSLRCSICWKLYVVNWIWNWHLIQLISTLSKYTQALQRLPLLQGDLETAQHSQQLVATYVALVHGKENPLAVDLLKQSAAKKKKSVKAIIIQHAQLYSS